MMRQCGLEQKEKLHKRQWKGKKFIDVYKRQAFFVWNRNNSKNDYR